MLKVSKIEIMTVPRQFMATTRILTMAIPDKESVLITRDALFRDNVISQVENITVNNEVSNEFKGRVYSGDDFDSNDPNFVEAFIQREMGNGKTKFYVDGVKDELENKLIIAAKKLHADMLVYNMYDGELSGE